MQFAIKDKTTEMNEMPCIIQTTNSYQPDERFFIAIFSFAVLLINNKQEKILNRLTVNYANGAV